ncbi:hypothetical protein KKF61_08085 [Patescibacteria group bacterium]|nr:hypothetical protein [Patescibacteria group bacterium]
MEQTGRLRINPFTGRYTRARETPTGKIQQDQISWQMERVLNQLKQFGPSNLETIREQVGIMSNKTLQFLRALERRKLVRCNAGKWEAEEKSEGRN